MGKRIHQVIIGGEVMLLCMVVALLSTQAASANPPSNGVSYNKNGQVTVENALDNLYSKVNYGDAKANEILKGKKALVGGKEVVGTYVAPTLASQTPGDATPENIDKGKIAWVNGEKVIGTRQLELVDKLVIGDYISYTPSITSYTIAKSDTGYTSDQTINPSALTMWRVTRKNKDGTVELVSAYSSNKAVSMWNSGKYIKILNQIAKAYETEGITVGSRHIGYNPSLSEDSGNFMGDTYYLKDLEVLEIIETIDELTTGSRSSLMGNGYWISAFDDNQYWSSAAYVCQRGKVCYSYLSHYSPNGSINNNDNHFVRPIIVLKSTIKLTGGNGTASSPYTLGV